MNVNFIFMRKFTLLIASLFITMGAMAQTLVDYKIVTSGDNATGVLSRTDTNTSSSWRDLFTYTVTEANPAQLTLKVTNPSNDAKRFNMFAQNDGVQIETGDGSSTYTLAVPAPYKIASYSFDVKANTAGNVITAANGEGEPLTIETSVSNFSVENVNSSEAVFELEGTNNRTNVCTNFVVKVYNSFEGKYLTLQCVSGEQYLTSSIGTTSDCRRLVMGGEGNKVFYYINNALLSYADGRFMKVAAKGMKYEMYWDEISVDTPVVVGFKLNGENVYSVTLGNEGEFVNNNTGGYRYLYGASSYSDSGTVATLPTGDGYKWYVEEVTELPVTVTEAGFATLYAPVALTVPTEVKAYTVTINGDWATLNEITSGIIPANTGVVIAGANGEAAAEGTYNFAITTTEETLESDLRGSVAATYYTEAGTYYALAQVDGVVGFYKDAFNNSRFQNNSHKAYLYVAGSANAASYSFRFGEGTTGVEKVEMRNEKSEIYDLTGRRVENPSNGIYIINGVKVLVK